MLWYVQFQFVYAHPITDTVALCPLRSALSYMRSTKQAGMHAHTTHSHIYTVFTAHCETNYWLTKPLVTVTAQLLTVVLPYIQVTVHVTWCCCASSSQHYEGTKILWNANTASHGIISADSHLLEYDSLIGPVVPDIPSCGSCWSLKEASVTVLQNAGNHWPNNRVIYPRITWISDLWLEFSI
jgi:hypothetical protein